MSRKDYSHKTRDVQRKLAQDGWIVARHGPGDHVQYKHPRKSGRVTLDAGARQFCLSMIFSENRYPLFRIML